MGQQLSILATPKLSDEGNPMFLGYTRLVG